jgi:hypothetical protein
MSAFRLFREPDDKATQYAFRILLAFAGILLVLIANTFLAKLLVVLLPHTPEAAFHTIFWMSVMVGILAGVGMVSGWRIGTFLDRMTSPTARRTACYAAEVLFQVVCLAAAIWFLRFVRGVNLFSAFFLSFAILFLFFATRTFGPLRKNILMTVARPAKLSL